MIAIIETDPTDLKRLLKQILLIFSKYANLIYVFSEDTANILLKHGNHNPSLKIIGMIFFGLLYNLSQNKLEVF